MSDTPVAEVLPNFRVLQELGIYTWNPGFDSNKQLKPHSKVTARDILERLSASDGGDDSLDKLLSGLKLDNSTGLPLVNYTGLRFPLTLRRDLAPQNYPNRFPNDAGYIVPMFVARKRGLDLASIDFILGGSSMDYLANRTLDSCDTSVYLTQKFRNMTLLVKYKEYTQNYADIGFQFERLVTGRNLEALQEPTRIDNLRVMKLGPFTCLVAADVDAVDSSGELVEIKSGNPNYFGIKLILQMISSGSKTLVNADKRGAMLLAIKKRSLAQLIRERPPEELMEVEKKIIESLKYLKEANVLHSEPSEVRFDAGKLVLCQVDDKSILPTLLVADELFGELENL